MKCELRGETYQWEDVFEYDSTYGYTCNQTLRFGLEIEMVGPHSFQRQADSSLQNPVKILSLA